MDSTATFRGRRKLFSIDPDPTVEELIAIDRLVRTIGFELQIAPRSFSLDAIQEHLRKVGPSYFLRQVELREDILGPQFHPDPFQALKDRLQALAPQDELLIVDRYFFSTGALDVEDYSRKVCDLLAPLASGASRIRVLTETKKPDVRRRIADQLRQEHPALRLETIETDRFHDRFWIADRTRGIVVGTSLSGVGSRIFLVDSLSEPDLQVVLDEVDSVANQA